MNGTRPQIEVLLLLRWSDIKASIEEASIDDQILPPNLDKETFFKYIKKVLLLRDGY